MQNNLKVRNKNELEHWRKNKGKLDKFWGHGTPVGQTRIKHRSGLIVSFIGKKHGLKVLEIGAGDGWYSQAFAKIGWDLTVTDLSPDLLKIAKTRVDSPKGTIKYMLANVYGLPFKGSSLDAVIGASILHHINLDKALPEIRRALGKGGKIAFCEPNMLNPQIMLQKNIPVLKKMAGDSPDETAYFRWQIEDTLKKFRVNKIKILPIDFLHPKTPNKLLSPISKLSKLLERTPLVREFAGSLFIRAVK